MQQGALVASFVTGIADDPLLREHLRQRVEGMGHWTSYFGALGLTPGASEARVDDLFDAMDASGHGSIHLDDLDTSMRGAGIRVSSQELSSMFSVLDNSGSRGRRGRVDRERFHELSRSATSQSDTQHSKSATSQPETQPPSLDRTITPPALERPAPAPRQSLPSLERPAATRRQSLPVLGRLAESRRPSLERPASSRRPSLKSLSEAAAAALPRRLTIDRSSGSEGLGNLEDLPFKYCVLCCAALTLDGSMVLAAITCSSRKFGALRTGPRVGVSSFHIPGKSISLVSVSLSRVNSV